MSGPVLHQRSLLVSGIHMHQSQTYLLQLSVLPPSPAHSPNTFLRPEDYFSPGAGVGGGRSLILGLLQKSSKTTPAVCYLVVESMLHAALEDS